MSKQWGKPIKKDKKRANKFNDKIDKFHFKYPKLAKEMDWSFTRNYFGGHYTGLIEERIFEIFEYLEGHSKWRKKLDNQYDDQRVELIEKRIYLLQIYSKLLQTDTETALIQLAFVEMKKDLSKRMESLNTLLATTTSQLRKTGLDEIVYNINDVNSEISLATTTNTSTLKPVTQWKGIEKGAILNSLFPNKTGYSLAKEFYVKLEVKRDSLKNAIQRSKDPNNPISKLEIDEEQAKAAMIDFLL